MFLNCGVGEDSWESLGLQGDPTSPSLEFTQTHVHWVGDAIQPSHPLSSPSPAFNLSQHQDLFKWVSSSHQVAKILEFQLQHHPSNEHSGLISFRMDCLDLLATERTLKSLLQRHSSKARQYVKKQRHHFANKGSSSQSYGFFSSHVWMWELDYKESWVPKNWCFWTVVLKKTLESPWTARRSNQTILKEISPECSLEGLMLKVKL